MPVTRPLKKLLSIVLDKKLSIVLDKIILRFEVPFFRGRKIL